MSSSDNDNDDNINYLETQNVNLDELSSKTKFTKAQIANFHKYFRKFKTRTQKDEKNLDLLKEDEFKNSLGVLSTRECDYISNRLFHVITGENSEYISFKEYILYLNLVNNGTREEKLEHCFKFFDIGNKGYITNQDFTNILYNLSLFLSSLTISQILVSENELSSLYDYYINKAKIQQLDFPNFKILLQNFPNFLDFYDIFNNNIYYDMNFFIRKEEVEKLITVKEKLYELKNLVNQSEIKPSSISLVTEDYIEDFIEARKDLENKSCLSLESNNKTNKKNVNNSNILKFSDFLLFSGDENELDGKSNKYTKSNNNNNNNFNIFLSSSNNKYQQNKEQEKEKDKKIYYTPMKDSNSFKFNTIYKNSDNSTILKRRDSSNDTILDLSESSFDSNHNEKNMVLYTNTKKPKKSKNNKKNIKNKKSSLKSKTEQKKSNYTNHINHKKNSEKISNSSNSKNGIKKNLMDILNEKHKNFQFLKPFTSIKDEKLKSCLKKSGYDIENILILTNKSKFKSFIEDVVSTLGNLINTILPERFKLGKRQGIRVEDLKDFDLNKISLMKNIQDKEVQNNIIHFGNPNLKTVINIMIGIKSAVSKIGTIPIKNLDLKISYLFPVDNLGVYEEMNRFIYEQNNYDGIVKCRFYDYAPKIFYNLRTMYGISSDDYLKSLGPENFLCNLIITKNKSLKEICSSGKSGSFFYFSYDGKYLMKTIPESEFLKFKEMLMDYYNYMYENPKTLLQRFFGLYMCIFDDVKMYFVVMNNVFNTPLKIHYKYDLKGSTYKRMSRKCKEINYTGYNFDIAMKDNDYTDRQEKIYLSSQYKRMLFEEAKRDSTFLSRHNINDYSFLIGVNDKKWCNKEQLEQEQYLLLSINKKKQSFESPVIRKPFYEEYYGGIRSEDNDKIYFFGIIDIFTNYGGKKKMEYIVKSVSQGNGISCKPPDEYSRRFINFVENILNTDNDVNFINTNKDKNISNNE